MWKICFITNKLIANLSTQFNAHVPQKTTAVLLLKRPKSRQHSFRLLLIMSRGQMRFQTFIGMTNVIQCSNIQIFKQIGLYQLNLSAPDLKLGLSGTYLPFASATAKGNFQNADDELKMLMFCNAPYICKCIHMYVCIYSKDISCPSS